MPKNDDDDDYKLKLLS